MSQSNDRSLWNVRNLTGTSTHEIQAIFNPRTDTCAVFVSVRGSHHVTTHRWSSAEVERLYNELRAFEQQSRTHASRAVLSDGETPVMITITHARHERRLTRVDTGELLAAIPTGNDVAVQLDLLRRFLDTAADWLQRGASMSTNDHIELDNLRAVYARMLSAFNITRGDE